MNINPGHLAIWGQFIGDSIGHYLLRTQAEQGSQGSHLWTSWKTTQTLPFKRATFSVYAHQARLFLQTYSARLYRDPEQFKKEVVDRLRKEPSNTLLSRAIHNGSPFDFFDLAPSVRLGPLATQFSKQNDMLSWLLPIIRIGTDNQIAITGALIYSSICWHLAQKKNLDELFSSVKEWEHYAEFESSTWWAYQQAFEIYSQYDEQEMLVFVSSFLDSSILSNPSAQSSLSILPILLKQARDETEFDLASILQWGGDLELLAGMKGCISALKHGIPAWLLEHYQTQKALSPFTIQSSPDSDDQQLRLF